MNTGECASEWTSARGNSELKLTCTFGRLCLQEGGQQCLCNHSDKQQREVLCHCELS